MLSLIVFSKFAFNFLEVKIFFKISILREGPRGAILHIHYLKTGGTPSGLFVAIDSPIVSYFFRLK